MKKKNVAMKVKKEKKKKKKKNPKKKIKKKKKKKEKTGEQMPFLWGGGEDGGETLTGKGLGKQSGFGVCRTGSLSPCREV